MSRFFRFLGLSEEEIDKLPPDLCQGGKLIDGLQAIYEEVPKGSKKDALAASIAEAALILLKGFNAYKDNLSEEARKRIEEEQKEADEYIPPPPSEVTPMPESEPEEQPEEETPEGETPEEEQPKETPKPPKREPKTPREQPKEPKPELDENDALIEHLRLQLEDLEF